MANAQKTKTRRRLRKSRGVRRRARGDGDRPRLSVCRSSRYISCQVIDDEEGRTLAAASQLEKSLREQCGALSKTESAKVIGRALADRLKDKNIAKVVFDRGWYRYHGRVKALADAVREGGVNF